MRSTLLAVITVSISVTSSGISRATLVFSNSWHYDGGNYPSAAQGATSWADAHQGDGDDLWYHVNGEGGYDYDHGYFPTIATDTWGNYIDIHQANSTPSAIWSKIGWDNGSGANYMSVNGATQIDFGMTPVIAVHGHTCGWAGPASTAFAHIVEVHQADAGTGPLWMSVGTATNINCNNGGDAFGNGGGCQNYNNCSGTTQWGGVSWINGGQYGTGFYPSVAVDSLGSTQACLLEVHQNSGPGYSQITFSSGVLSITQGSSWSYTGTAGGALTPLEVWGPTGGQHPSTCIYDGHGGANFWDTGVVVMEYNGSELWECDGAIGYEESTGKNCVWGADGKGVHCAKYDNGYYPRVSCESGAANGNGTGVQGIEVHQGTDSTSTSPFWARTFTEQ